MAEGGDFAIEQPELDKDLDHDSDYEQESSIVIGGTSS